MHCDTELFFDALIFFIGNTKFNLSFVLFLLQCFGLVRLLAAFIPSSVLDLILDGRHLGLDFGKTWRAMLRVNLKVRLQVCQLVVELLQTWTWLMVFLAELNDMEVFATDIGNTYLEAKTAELVYIIARPEFGDLEGHVMIIYKALYGLTTSGLRWHERLADCL